MNSEYRSVRTIELQSDHAEMASDNYNGGAGPTAGYNSTDRFEQTRREVDQVVDVMRDNVNKVLERDTKLSELDARAENLEAASVNFATSAKRVRKKMWWENMKMKLIIGGVVMAILIIIITIIAVKTSGGDDNSGNNGSNAVDTTATDTGAAGSSG